MSLIDATYFKLDINIPSSTYNNLSTYITQYEKEILQKLLGYELWKLVNAYDSETSPQRIIDLVEGKEYTSNSILMKWNGLINSDKVSLIAFYVYYWYVRNNVTTLQGLGERQAKTENSIMANPSMKLSNAWFRLENLYGSITQSRYVASAYNFLVEHKDEYPEWEFKEIGNVNSFDL